MKRMTMVLAFIVAGCGPKQGTPVTTPATPAAVTASPAPMPAPRATDVAADTITERAIRAHMEFLASDALNGRGSGTRDEWIAATYIASQFRLWGLEPMGDDGGYVQAIEMAGVEATVPPVLRAGNHAWTHGKEMVVQALGSTLPLSGPLIKFQTGATIPPGAIVLLPASAMTADRTAVAAAAMVISPLTPQVQTQWEPTASRLPTMPLRAVKLPPTAAPRATRIIVNDAALAALEAMPAGGIVRFEAATRPTPSTFTWNAVGKITGSHPVAGAETIVLSAHLDHIGARAPQPGVDTINNGADDDASGTVAVMALAEALVKGPRPRRTIVFALFGSEERGGFGAGFFVNLPVVPLDRLVADLQFEMLGRPDPKIPPNHLWLTGYERSNLGPELGKQGAALVADPHPEQSFFTRSDNIRFAQRGVVAHTVSSYNLHKEYHTVEDEIRLIDFPHMTASIKSLVRPIRWLADAPFKPAWNPGGCPSPCK
jgi:Zn-dependent M28 family amino/carboxypeptidase